MATRTILFGIASLFVGFFLTGTTVYVAYHSRSSSVAALKSAVTTLGIRQRQVIGFLPYWLLNTADTNATSSLTTLTYFGVTLKGDGTIRKYSQPGEAEPGWYALQSGKADVFLNKAKERHQTISLLVFSGEEETIAELMSDPVAHAQTMVQEVAPVMKQYGFDDLNIDIESVIEASPSSRTQFTSFIAEVKSLLQSQHLGTLTIDVSPANLIHQRLIELPRVAQTVDTMVLMTYDYHYSGSIVTGPVAPIGGAGVDAEYDVETAIQKALAVVPEEKIILGVPLYGYEWETLADTPRSAILPGSGKTISQRRVEQFLSSCASCSAQWDDQAQESYLIYRDQETGTFHQMYYPDERSLAKKIQLMNQYQLPGLALWALGYEGSATLSPLNTLE